MTRRPDPDLGGIRRLLDDAARGRGPYAGRGDVGDPPPRRGCWPLLILPICVALTLAAGALYGAVS